jgi:hypothetical protein
MLKNKLDIMKRVCKHKSTASGGCMESNERKDDEMSFPQREKRYED